MTAAAMTFVFGAVSLVVGVAIALRLVTGDSEIADAGRVRPLVLIPGVAAVAYVVMALGIGTVTIGSETIVVPRYVDWLLTTPIMIGYVGYVAGAPRRWIAAAAGGIAAVIVVGAAATVTTGLAKWGLFGLSSLVQLGVFGVLYLVYPKHAAERPGRRELFWLLQTHVGLLWLAYPVIWLFSPAGIGAVTADAANMVIVYMDVVAKTPYVYFVWTHRDAFAEGTSAPEAPAESGPAAGD